jgi:hypothetical protein
MGNNINRKKPLENRTFERQNSNRSNIQADDSSKQSDSFRRKSKKDSKKKKTQFWEMTA